MPIDPQIAAMFAGTVLAPASSMPLQAFRSLVRESARAVPAPSVVLRSIKDRRIAGPAGDIPVRIYTPEGNEPFPLIVFFHSGGWVVGDLDSEDAIARVFAAAAGAVVVSVEYRLAPEHTFPAANDDAYAATRWAVDHAAEIGATASKVAVVGASTGGVLATAVALRARDEQGPSLAGFVNFYGSCNYPSRLTGSAREFSDGIVLKAEDITFFYNTYLGDPQKYQDDPQASPFRAKSLNGLAPGYIGTAECDPSRDDAEAFAEKMKRDGGDVTLKRYPGMIHGFLSWAAFLPGAQEAINDASEWLKKRFTV